MLKDRGLFVGKDQTMINIYGFQASPGSSVKLQSWKRPENCKVNYDDWFFYQLFFAVAKFYKCSYTDRLSLLANL